MHFKNLSFVIVLIGLISVAIPLRAQGGCVDSPEDPTIVLALLAGAGFGAARLKRFFRRDQ
jgi:XrtJ-associated TM-motif-TM protein